jgi:copper homeostasis protein
MLIEICADRLNTALAAEQMGAGRLELCAALTEGGLTPPQSLIEAVCSQLHIPVNVMIRPRSGDFLYDDAEFRLMEQDIRNAKKAGASGVVFGLLLPDGSVDKDRCRMLMVLAAPLKVTFHRAFDMTSDPFLSLEEIISLGADTLLTSGHRQTAEDGLELIRELVKRASGRITIMAGGGINSTNAPLLAEAGVRAFHFTARRMRSGHMKYRNEALDTLGSTVVPGEYELAEPDQDKVSDILQSLGIQ